MVDGDVGYESNANHSVPFPVDSWSIEKSDPQPHERLDFCVRASAPSKISGMCFSLRFSDVTMLTILRDSSLADPELVGVLLQFGCRPLGPHIPIAPFAPTSPHPILVEWCRGRSVQPNSDAPRSERGASAGRSPDPSAGPGAAREAFWAELGDALRILAWKIDTLKDIQRQGSGLIATSEPELSRRKGPRTLGTS